MVKKTKREKSRGVCIRLNKLLFCHCDELSSLSLRGSETTKQSQSGIAALTSFARNDGKKEFLMTFLCSLFFNLHLKQ